MRETPVRADRQRGYPETRRRTMNVSLNLSHWVCLLAGLLLMITGFLLRDIVIEKPAVLTHPAGSRGQWRRSAGYGRRTVMIAVGLLAAAYGISRIFF